MTELLAFIGLALFSLMMIGMFDDPEDPGVCRKCGDKMVFRGYEGNTRCLRCERSKLG